jgi:hypothetical protein
MPLRTLIIGVSHCLSRQRGSSGDPELSWMATSFHQHLLSGASLDPKFFRAAEVTSVSKRLPGTFSLPFAYRMVCSGA